MPNVSSRLIKGFSPAEQVGGNFPALLLVRSSRLSRSVARGTFALLLVAVLAMALLPWQQTSRGEGVVLARDPQLRIARVQATYDGIVKKVADGMVEGAKVTKDQVILELEPFANDEIQQTRGILKAYQDQLLNEQQQLAVYESQVAFVQSMTAADIEKAKNAIESGKNKLQEKSELIAKYQAERTAAEANVNASKYLFDKGLEPGLDFVKYTAAFNKAEAEYKAALQSRDSIKAELAEKVSELEKIEASALDKNAEQQRKVAESKAKMQSTQAKITETEIKLKAYERLVLKAPFNGTLYRLIGAAGVQTVKKGDELFTVVPDTDDLAVELTVVGNDTSFMREGQEVRLQFEGWPAVQFVGWPSIAVGTFTGRVQTIDRYSEGAGKFRILVVPDWKEIEQSSSEPWPSRDILRQGMRANGWVILNEVRLGYEVWRQLNGFPPAMDDGSKSSKEDKGSKIKLPK